MYWNLDEVTVGTWVPFIRSRIWLGVDLKTDVHIAPTSANTKAFPYRSMPIKPRTHLSIRSDGYNAEVCSANSFSLDVNKHFC